MDVASGTTRSQMVSPMATIEANTGVRWRTPIASRWQPRPHHDDATIKTHDFAYLNGAPEPSSLSKIIEAIQTSLLPIIAQPLLLRTLFLIFGGCCSNVYSLEFILTLSSSTGTLITFLQFLSITLYTLPSQLTFTVTSPPEPPPLKPTRTVWIPCLKPRRVPIEKWAMFAAQFVIINILNNAAFGYKISLPLHIILRSAGPVASMAVGYIWAGKRYSSHKVFSVMLLFLGVVTAALSDAGGKKTSRPVEDRSDSGTDVAMASVLVQQAPGFALLTLALIMSAVMGIWSDSLYSKYGRSGQIAQEQLFYGHLLSLPFFLAQYATMQDQLDILLSASRNSATAGNAFASSLQTYITSSAPDLWQGWMQRLFSSLHISDAVVYLLLNSVTQIACISGVHHLSTQTSALTVSIVLNIRKVASLLLSIYIFGNSLPLGVLVGAAVVFSGGGLYGISSTLR